MYETLISTPQRDYHPLAMLSNNTYEKKARIYFTQISDEYLEPMLSVNVQTGATVMITSET